MAVDTPRYNVKLYDITWNNVKTVAPRLILNKPTFSSSINSWPDMIKLEIAKEIDNEDYKDDMFIEITEYTDNNKVWRPLFGWMVESIPWTLSETRNTIGLECKWLHQMLSKVLYKSGTDYTFFKNDTVENILTDILSRFNWLQQRNPVNYNWFIGTELLKVWTIWNATVDMKFEDQTCLEAIISLFEYAWFYFVVTPDGYINAGVVSATPQHNLTLRKDVQSLTIKKRDLSGIINHLVLEANGGTIKEYTDSDSITAYWIRQSYEKKPDINNDATQDSYGNSIILENKDPKREITVKVNSKYDLSSIYPGQTIKIRNLFAQQTITDTFELLDIDWDNLLDIDWDVLYIKGTPTIISENLVENSQIIKTSYDWNTMTLNVERYVSLAKLILWK